MSDRFDQEAEALLPCQWITRLCERRYEEECYGCFHRPAVAARLRADGGKLEYWNRKALEWSNQIEANTAKIDEAGIIFKAQLAQAQAEIERLKTMHVSNESEEQCRGYVKEIAALCLKLAEAQEDAHALLRVMALHPLTAERCNVVGAVEARLAATRS